MQPFPGLTLSSDGKSLACKQGAIFELPHVPTATPEQHLVAIKALGLVPQDGQLTGWEVREYDDTVPARVMWLKVWSDYLPVVPEGAMYEVRRVLGVSS